LLERRCFLSSRVAFRQELGGEGSMLVGCLVAVLHTFRFYKAMERYGRAITWGKRQVREKQGTGAIALHTIGPAMLWRAVPERRKPQGESKRTADGGVWYSSRSCTFVGVRAYRWAYLVEASPGQKYGIRRSLPIT